jgi:hypothetical protein
MEEGADESCGLRCLSCSTTLTRRACKSVLLSDHRISLYSTSHPTRNVRPVGRSYVTHACECMVNDISCASCKVVVGYHILRACRGCLEARNNGHLWMFDVSATIAGRRRELECSGFDIFEPEFDYEVKIR